MKRKKLIVALLILAIFGFFTILITVDNAQTKDLRRVNIELKVNTSKSSYTLGEVVVLNTEIANNGESEVFLRGWNARSGMVKILIAKEDQKFKQYDHSQWIRTTAGRFIKPGETIKSSATLLWNFSPTKRFVSPQRFEETYIMTDLAFPEPGVYFLKALLIMPAAVPGQDRTEVESEPVQIVVNEPVGEDIRVWKKIEENSELAYFMQEGSPRSAKEEEREKLVKEVEQIIADNPNSFLAGEMRKGLEKYRESEAKLKEFKENLKRRQKPSN